MASGKKNIKLREAQHCDARLIKSMSEDTTRTGLSILMINNGNDWIKVTKKKIWKRLFSKNYNNFFNQAKETPFCLNPLLEAVGPLGISDAAQQILIGTFTLPGK